MATLLCLDCRIRSSELFESAETQLSASWEGQTSRNNRTATNDDEDHEIQWASGTGQDLSILSLKFGLNELNSKVIQFSGLTEDASSLLHCSTALRKVALTAPEDYPPFHVPELPSSVDRDGVLLLQRAKPHLLYPRVYCLLVFEESSFEDPVYLASKITQAFNFGEIYRAWVANQLSHESTGRVPIGKLDNDVTGAIHLWTSRLLGRKPVWSDWQFYHLEYAKSHLSSKRRETPNIKRVEESSADTSDSLS